MSTRRLLVTLALSVAPCAARAQTAHGSIVDAADRPVFGVVVLLEDSTSRVAARGLSTDRGEFRLVAPRNGTYRIRTLRIGFRPVVSEPIVLVAGTDITRRIVITTVALGLDTVRVTNQSVCRAFTDSAAATYAVWEQIRTALTAAELTAAARNVVATTVAYERSIDPFSGRDGKITGQRWTVSTSYVTHEWRAVPPDSLHRLGYIDRARDNSVIYYAPGLDMLLSPMFVEDHCFKLVTDSRRRTRLGLAFEPTPDRRRTKLAEVGGTVWVDRASSALLDLEFTYTNADAELQDYAGGGLSFARMRDGTWAISRWDIRMPVVEQVVVPGHGTEPRLREIRSAGGSLALTTRGSDTLWAAPLTEMRGVVFDSASGAPLADAFLIMSGTQAAASSDSHGRFTVNGMLPGQYTAVVHTPSLDSMNAVHRAPVTFADSSAIVELRVPNGKQLAHALCPNNGDAGGIVVGALRAPGGAGTPPVSHGRVVAEWLADARDSTRVRRLELPATTAGDFRLCGLPLNTAIRLVGVADGAHTATAEVIRIVAGSRLARIDLAMESDALGATFSGVVVSDSTGAPIAGAEVSFPELAKSVVTDERGVFRVLGIPAGEQRVSVRRLGFGAADARVTFSGHETLERRVVLGRAVTLDAVRVVDRFTERRLRDFEDNRRLGLGHFLTRDELDKYGGMNLSSVLAQFPGVMALGGQAQSWVVNSRQPVACVGKPTKECLEAHGYYFPEREDGFDLPTACHPLVWVDGVAMNAGSYPTRPIDLKAFPPERVEAVEYYRGTTVVPMQYARRGSECGVLVIWLRRD